jgi:hypothetical protein
VFQQLVPRVHSGSQLRKYVVCQLKDREVSWSQKSVEYRVSERKVELMLERKVVHWVGLKSEKSVHANYSVKPEREQSINEALSSS